MSLRAAMLSVLFIPVQACSLLLPTALPPLPVPIHESPRASAPTSYPTSGGMTVDGAEPLMLGSTVEGMIRRGKRYYRISFDQGQALRMKIYGKLVVDDTGDGLDLKLLAPDGERLAYEGLYISSSPETAEVDVAFLEYVSDIARVAILEVDCGECDTGVQYRFVTSSPE